MTKFEEKLEILPIKTIQHPIGDTKYYTAIHVKTLIAQADEEIANLKSQLQQQALPVVPKWLDIEIKHFKSTSKHPTVDVVFGVADAIVAVKNGNTHSKLYDYLFCGKQDVCNQHQAIFALAFITGKYEVEKPQLFYLKNKITGMYLSSDGEGLYEQHKNHGFKFTQEDINSLDTGSYEQIPVPVEDGE